MKIKVIVATHKKYKMPNDKMYLPLQVGAEGKEDLGYQKDNTNDNISIKNPFFCELTGLYWAWKNLDADYVGLCHYRRYFSCSKSISKDINEKINSTLNYDETVKILSDDVNIILPKKRNYYIENLYSHYKHTMYEEPIKETRKIILEKYPEYLKEFDNLHKRKSAHMFNIFIMRKDLLDKYCTWLFDILFQLEKRIDIKKYDSFQARFFGRISELLLDIWINTNNLSYKEVKVIDIEKVNWLKKGTSFLLAKFTGKRYRKSF